MVIKKQRKLFLMVGAVILISVGLLAYNQLDNSSVKIEKNNSQQSNSQSSAQSTPQATTILVHLGGAVSKPGVYECSQGSRLYKVLEKADGPTSQADLNAVNLAREVRDGEKILIPNQSNSSKEIAGESSTDFDGQLVNINTASKAKLQQISGVGPATAKKIINYRRQHNSFQSKTELTKVNGIGDKTLAKIKDQITY